MEEMALNEMAEKFFAFVEEERKEEDKRNEEKKEMKKVEGNYLSRRAILLDEQRERLKHIRRSIARIGKVDARDYAEADSEQKKYESLLSDRPATIEEVAKIMTFIKVGFDNVEYVAKFYGFEKFKEEFLNVFRMITLGIIMHKEGGYTIQVDEPARTIRDVKTKWVKDVLLDTYLS